MTGLSSKQALELKQKGQGNNQVSKSAKTVKDIVKENTLTYFNLIFAVLAVLLVLAQAWNGLTFLPVIIANTLIGIIQEIQAKKVLDHLTIMNTPVAKAYRDGRVKKIAIEDLVLGDVIVLEGGVQIPADAEVVSGEIAVNEALLTGEADEITKQPGDELMSGAFVVSGKCTARLVRVGEKAYINQLTLKAKAVESDDRSEMVRAIDGIVKLAGIVIIPIGILLLYQSVGVAHRSFVKAVPSMVAAVIGMIPEGLYLLLSVTLAVSAMRLAKKQVMLHDMKSIESLARVDVVCVDKTGTITDNAMLVADVVPVQKMNRSEMERAGALVSRYLGAQNDENATSVAMTDYFGKNQKGANAVEVLPFSSRYKYSAVQFREGVFVLGAPEIVLKQRFRLYEQEVNHYAQKGYRVIVFAKLEGASAIPKENLGQQDVNPVFFILLTNPIRKNAPKTFQYFENQGVTVKVISGDNPVTVSEVARKANISGAEDYVNAQDLKTQEDIDEAVKKTTVFGRVTPEQKRQIVHALQAQGHTVAMTGDGVNDILAMKDSDCSIAMASGSDAAVQAAQVALLDSDFSHMPQIVSEGRRVINNIERSATLFLVKNIFSFLLSIFTIVSIMDYPLTPSQISLISMFNIGIPAFFLAMEPNNRRIEGHFIQRVMLRAMPAALTDFFMIAALVVFGKTFGVGGQDISVAATFLLAIVGFMILYNISSPLNVFRGIVIAGCIAGLVVLAVTMNQLFDIQFISVKCVMLFVLFAVATVPCMRILTKLFVSIDRAAARRREEMQQSA
ncbi:HAD-IC family P-type ATPase [Pseudoramibacter sp.]|uniref:HAD-IC family P-type ATPase n=1 Tax=Pseudoramibacter sp. TaxID=2034862 RepID=UPI0025F92813|nr:HAD-IC family P-type ATPase [Pseudoramibacter sp.]MCH4072555.1 cation-translocating P-type ATPase [Pseudoramibacter sp.]MCH4106326.1 cation-translocating P-type ATPase [Pseudoramibacter sp.]